jgi:MFS superfamily sulfate permease-like transporter
VFRLGFLADFLSRSALIGFLTGVGLQVAISELAGLVGLSNVTRSSVGQVISFVERIGDAHVATLAVGLAALAVIAGFKHLAPKLPGALIAVVGGIAASAIFDLSSRGIATIGRVPGGLPSFGVPPLHLAKSAAVLATGASCFLVIVAQSAATARAFAARYAEAQDENTDLVGLAAANAAAALTGTFVVNGSPTQTEVLAEAGGRSQIAHFTTATIVLVVLLFLTKPLGLLPLVFLSAIVFMIGIKLVDVRGLKELYRLQRDEFRVAVAIAAVVVGAGVMPGIIAAVGLSLVDYVRHSYRPRTRLLVSDGAGGWMAVPVARGVLAAPGVVAYRFESNLFYANANGFMDEVFGLVSDAGSPVRWLVIDASGIDQIDYSAAKTLIRMRDELGRRGIRVTMVAASADLCEALARYGLGFAPGTHPFPTVADAMASIRSGSR